MTNTYKVSRSSAWLKRDGVWTEVPVGDTFTLLPGDHVSGVSPDHGVRIAGPPPPMTAAAILEYLA